MTSSMMEELLRGSTMSCEEFAHVIQYKPFGNRLGRPEPRSGYLPNNLACATPIVTIA
jgi:hypothetical protein